MKALALRAALAGLLVTTVAFKLLHAGASQADIGSAVVDLIAQEGWSARKLTAEAAAPFSKVIAFRASGCAEDGQVYFVDLGFQLAPMLDRSIGPDYTRYVAYLGRKWAIQDRLGLRLEWLKQKTLSTLGLGRYAVNEIALVIAEPRACQVSDKVDWSAAWRRPDGGQPMTSSVAPAGGSVLFRTYVVGDFTIR